MNPSESDTIVEELKAMKQRMDVLFDETLFDMNNTVEASTRAERLWQPPMDVWETSAEWVLKADLPGLLDEDVAVHVSDGILTVSGVRRPTEYPLPSEVHVAERPQGAFRRSFPLPQDACADRIEAQFKGGVLTVTVQRRREPAEVSRKIPVRSA